MLAWQNRVDAKVNGRLGARTEPQHGDNTNTEHMKGQAMRINLSTEALAEGGVVLESLLIRLEQQRSRRRCQKA